MKIFKISDTVYNVLKWIAQVGLPGAGTLYAALAKIWGFPYGEEIVATVTAVDLCLGLYLGISTKQYNNQGSVQVTDGQ